MIFLIIVKFFLRTFFHYLIKKIEIEVKRISFIKSSYLYILLFF